MTTTTIDQYKLETIFNSDDTVSHIDRTGPVTRTTWKRDKELGVGGFGEVWREKEIGGGELRAVKTIPKIVLKSNKVAYKRGLQVLVQVKNV